MQTSSPPVRARRWHAASITGALLALLGLLLGGGGLLLISLGGSWYYACAGAALVVAGVALGLGSHLALWLYAALLGATLLWALWESGLDWWPLAARLDLLFVLGLFLLTPWVARRLGGSGAMQPPLAGSDVPPATRASVPAVRLARRALLAVLGVTALVSLGALMHDSHDISGTFPAAASGTAPVAPAAAAGAAAAMPLADAVPDDEWQAYGRTGHGQRYSPLAQITPDNAGKLELAWQFRTGDVRGRPGDPVETTFEVAPLKIGQRLFLCTPHQAVIALDAASGKQLWRHDTQVKGDLALQHLTCRGLSYQPPVQQAAPAQLPSVPAGQQQQGSPQPPAEAPANACRAKLFMPTADGRLLALNPDTGALCPGFGKGGVVDLWAGMPNVSPGAYYSTSPAAVSSKYVIVGGTVLDNVSTREQSGVIRAFDIETGALVWNWDSANPEQTAPLPPGQLYTANSPNSWSIASVDQALNMVYLPMGNQPPDQWGGKRTPAVERYSSSVVALDLDTGKVRWGFQTVHHDLWDYDVPSQPSLVDLRIGGAVVPALVQPTKQGELFVLDRRTGLPLLPVHEAPAPQGAATGDRTAPTQPVSALSFNPPPLEGKHMWGATLFDQLACRVMLRRLRYDGRFTPPSEQGSLIYPGNFGVFNWGGVAIDPVRQMAFTTPAYLAFTSKLIPRKNETEMLVQGKTPPHGMLPKLNENVGAPYAVKLAPFTSPLGIPCQQPPWGYVAGADLASGKVVWQHRNGTVRDLSPVPVPFKMGVPSLGGPLVTAGGVAFLSGTMDNFIRAYDSASGKQLWEARLPAGGQATPVSYGANGQQYIVVAAGGHGSTGTKAGDYVMAYKLPAR